MTRVKTSELVVVGGGAIGMAAAWRARAEGIEVEIVDPAPGGGASWAAAGMLAPVTEAHSGEESLLALNLEAAAAYPDFVSELESFSGLNVGYRRTGTLMVARNSDENEELAELWRLQQRLGLASERLRSRECRKIEPGLSPSVRGGIFVENDHQIDNRALVDSLRTACERSGVRFRRERVSRVDVDGDRVRSVVLESGETIAAGTVLIAAGARSGDLDGLPPDCLRVRPVKGQLLHLFGPPGSDVASHTVRGLDVYAVPRGDGRLVIGATVEERGWDERVTAGGVFVLLRDAYELLPGITELDLRESTVGLRPGTPDNAPLIGKTEVDGLLCATGHYRNGVLLTAVTADAIVKTMIDGVEPASIRDFSPMRFKQVEKAQL